MFNKIFTGLPEHRTPQLPACVLSSWFHKRLEKNEKIKPSIGLATYVLQEGKICCCRPRPGLLGSDVVVKSLTQIHNRIKGPRQIDPRARIQAIL